MEGILRGRAFRLSLWKFAHLPLWHFAFAPQGVSCVPYEGHELSATGERKATDGVVLDAPLPLAPAGTVAQGSKPGMTAPRRRARAAATAPTPRKRRSGFLGRLEAFISRLSTRNNFWHRVCSLIWLPYAFRSGIRMKRLDASTFTAVLPFRRFNKNWYNAMAGAALLANSEIAGGMYLFAAVGADYTVVCKELRYRFLRPCLGPAVYRVKPPDNIQALVAGGQEFNIEVELDVVQQRLPTPGRARRAERENRVGHCLAVFHVTPKAHHEAREKRRSERDSPAGPLTNDTAESSAA